jgi:molecular chaperone DnaJ
VLSKPRAPDCSGAGRVRKERSLKVNIPAGIEDGTRVRLGGEGEAGVRGAQAGDLYIFVSIKPHPLFSREGADLHCRVPISMTKATLGGEIDIPSIDGSKGTISVQAGTQTGQQYRLRGKGMSVMKSSHRGDLYVETVVETPRHLTKRQKELLEEFAQEETGNEAKTSPDSHSFFSRVKDFFEGLAE